VKGLLKEKSTISLFIQWEKLDQLRDYNCYTCSDVCGPMSTDSIGGRRSFTDYSHCFPVYFIKHKSEVLEKFKEFATATSQN